MGKLLKLIRKYESLLNYYEELSKKSVDDELLGFYGGKIDAIREILCDLRKLAPYLC